MSSFVDYLPDVFSEFGAISVRKMFGGYGVYHEQLMFGLVADDALYLKANAATAQHFESRGLRPFEYDKGGKIVKMSYYLAPEDIYDDPAEAAIWARRAYDVALLGKSNRKKP